MLMAEQAAEVARVAADATSAAAGGGAREWPTWGRDGSRNMVGNAANLPVEVNPGEMDDETEEIDLTGAKNIRWVAKLGSQSYGTTSVAFGKVFAGTNNESPRDKPVNFFGSLFRPSSEPARSATGSM